MDYKKFVKDGQTIRTHCPAKFMKQLKQDTDSSQGHTTIWPPGQKVR